MTNDYARVLEATEKHLQALKAGGVRFLTVEGETLRQLQKPPTLPPLPRPTVKPAVTEAYPTPQFRRAERRDALNSPSAPLPPTPAPALSPSPTPIPPPTPVDAETAMSTLRTRAMKCVQCPHLAGSRKNVVFGVGNIRAELMFVGEAPGADEDEQGEPFVGAAGQLLTRIIKTMGFSRETVYIANILKCRPDTPGKTSGNRKPTADEMQTCLPYLLEQIELIRPKVLVALGATAIEGLLGKTEGIGRLRGHFQTFRNIPLMPTFHPAYLLRNQALTEKRKVWEDMLQVLEKLNAPISEKQRGYFFEGLITPAWPAILGEE